MAYQEASQAGIDYVPCRYGSSRTLFRGPAKNLAQPYVAVLGGTETYGRFIERPYPDLLEETLGTTTVNFGCVNAGLDVYVNDNVVLGACAEAAYTVIQIVGAPNMSNRFYTVHPRRNDRFLRAARRMAEIWPDIDFTEIHFTRHLLNVLKGSCPDRFVLLEQELAQAWTARMRSLIRECDSRVILLWMSDRRPEDPLDLAAGSPLFVTREMIESLRPDVLDIVEVVAPEPFSEKSAAGMVYRPLEQPAAAALPGPDMHTRVTDALAGCLRHLL